MCWVMVVLIVIAIPCALLVIYVSNHPMNIVHGDSMKPTFSDCTLVISNKNFPPKYTQEGNIAVIDISEQEAKFDKIAHRVMSNNAETQMISTRGDNGSYYDYPSSIDGFFGYDKYLGKVEQYYALPPFFCGE